MQADKKAHDVYGHFIVDFANSKIDAPDFHRLLDYCKDIVPEVEPHTKKAKEILIPREDIFKGLNMEEKDLVKRSVRREIFRYHHIFVKPSQKRRQKVPEGIKGRITENYRTSCRTR